jgi:poly-gamma-glutamate synthase PgsB/CapB
VFVTGTRGRSSTVRALHAALSAAGRATYAKTTGTAAAEIDVYGRETPTSRVGQVTIEVLRIMHKALGNRDKPAVLVFECMAVRPNLIAVLAHDMLKPNITAITNAQVDHLEDEGSSLQEIARAMSEAITPGSFVITDERATAPLSAIREVAQSRGALLVEAVPEHLPPDSSTRPPYVHPQNITFVLNTTWFLGIEDGIAIDGMARASKEPGEFEVWRRSVGDIDVTDADFDAINDPHSMSSALRGFDWPPARSSPRLALLTGRWVRPYRDLSFIESIERQPFDGVPALRRERSRWLVLAGGTVFHFLGLRSSCEFCDAIRRLHRCRLYRGVFDPRSFHHSCGCCDDGESHCEGGPAVGGSHSPAAIRSGDDGRSDVGLDGSLLGRASGLGSC